MPSWYLKGFEWTQSLPDLYAKLYLYEYSFFLYSSLLPNENSRFSYMSCNPHTVFSASRNEVIVRKNENLETFQSNPFDVFEGLINRTEIDYCFDTSIFGKKFFKGGAVGYWGYEMKDHIENLPSSAADNPGLPDSRWMFYDGLIVIDHLYQKPYFIGTEGCIQKLETLVNSNTTAQREKQAIEYEITHSVTQNDYLKQISVVKEYIANGDVYEVNLAQRFNIHFQKKDAWADFHIFKSLAETSPSPFSALLKCGDVTVISSSPERFLRIEDRHAESKPIKGTRSRRNDFFQDEAMYFELLNSEKDRAENVMIVDLVRNDLGRVSETGSVQVDRLFHIEKYATVYQMVSSVKSKLKTNCNNIDALKACFPPGSMTGAPKIRAMQIIEELEPFKRGVYSGALGYIGYDGNMDLSVVIRTLILQGENGYFQTGGAIVWDSIPTEEYQECLDKARGIIKALERLNSG